MAASHRLGRRLTPILWLFPLALLIPLQCVRPAIASAEYQQVKDLLLRGDLIRSQHLADKCYTRFERSNPEWASRFELLEAEAMVWRRLDEKALSLLNTLPASVSLPDQTIQETTLEGVAFTHLQRFPEADRKFATAEHLCRAANSASCGSLQRARGAEAMQLGQFALAHDFFLKCLQSARIYKDRWLESSALSNLGFASLQDEHYDESISWSNLTLNAALSLGADDLAQRALGNLGWAHFKMGDSEVALQLLLDAERRATKLKIDEVAITWLTDIGYVYADSGRIQPAYEAYSHALELARKIKSTQNISDILTDLGLLAVGAGSPDEADKYATQSLAMAQISHSRPDICDAIAIRMQASALRGDELHSRQLLTQVENAPESQTSMKWASQRAMARLYEDQHKAAEAQAQYQSALNTFELARAQLQHEDSMLPFIANATGIYDDYIHFLIAQGKIREALLIADQSRARTLAQGLGLDLSNHSARRVPIDPQAVSKKSGSTLLFYWLGSKRSCLWLVTPTETKLFNLPPRHTIAALVSRYRNALKGSDDPVLTSNDTGSELYATLIGPASSLIDSRKPIMILADGDLSQLNFETLIAPAPTARPTPGPTTRPAPHYWIEDVTLSAAPSLSMLAAARAGDASKNNILMLGNPVLADDNFPELPNADREMTLIQNHFAAANSSVFTRQRANPSAYFSSSPNQFAYIHFVAHGAASSIDPLDSAIILSEPNGAPGAFKLYAREIMQQPINARLVTISACFGSGSRAYAGEGLVGLSWAFLKAGAHNTIGAMWEASDEASPRLMDALYQGLQQGQSPAAALRNAKLSLLHSHTIYRKPFYWAPFQIYTRL